MQGDMPVGGDGTPPLAPVVTLAGLYGAAGSVVGPRVAERLGVPFLDRGILVGVAEELRVPEASVADLDPESPQRERGVMRRYLDSLERAAGADSTPMSDIELVEARYRSETEEFLARATVRGGVVLGRGGAVVLQSVPGALHVMLTGSRDGRVHQAMRLEGIDLRTAERRLQVNDRARKGYVRRAYGVDGENPDLYHLQIDSTVFDLDTCVDLIVAAAKARVRQRATTDRVSDREEKSA